MANKLISINTEKAPGTQLPGVVQQEIVSQLVPRVTNVLAGQVTLLRTELDALAVAVAAGGTGGADPAAVSAAVTAALTPFGQRVAALESAVTALTNDVPTQVQLSQSALLQIINNNVDSLVETIETKADKSELNNYLDKTNAYEKFQQAFDLIVTKADQTDLTALKESFDQLVADLQLSGTTDVSDLANTLNDTVTLLNRVVVLIAGNDNPDATIDDAVHGFSVLLPQAISGYVVKPMIDALKAEQAQTDAQIVQQIIDSTQDTLQTVNDYVDQIVVELTRLNVDKANASTIRKFGSQPYENPDDSIDEFLELLNDLIGKLLDATGVVPRAGKIVPVDSGATRIAELEAEIARLTAAGGVLPSGECATKLDLSEYVKKSDLGVLQPVPVPPNVKVPYPVVGEGVSLITPSNTMNVTFMHTPGPDDNFLLVFVSYMIPSVVPGGSVWNIKVTYGGKQATFFQEYNSASVAADRTRGTVQGYWLSITPDPTQTPQEVVVTCTTGMDLAGKTGTPTYAFRSNSVTMSNRTTSSHVGGDGSGAASINVAGAAGFNRRHIGFVHVPTTPSRTYINTVSGPAHVLWEVDDNGGRRVMIYTTTDEHQIVHGGQAANAYASGFITVNALAPPKVI